MDSFFNRKKSRIQTRQASVSSQDLDDNSVPYDQIAQTALASPIRSAAISRAPNQISAPLTNPTLTSAGTELNKFVLLRSRADRDRDKASTASMSASTDASVSGNQSVISHHAKSTSVSTTDYSVPDASLFNSYSSVITRPISGVSDSTDPEINAEVNNAWSGTDLRSHFSQTSPSLNLHIHARQSTSDDFHFPRPETEEEIETLFDNVRRKRGIPDMLNLSLDQKWHMVYNDEQIRWREREDHTKRHTITGQASSPSEGTPEWYIKKFLDKTITSKQAGSLLVSLRSKEMR